MSNSPVLIVGGGIGGLTCALTLHQIGVPCIVFESVPEIRPLGVGINLQPNAVRELYELGFDEASLDEIGLQTREWALVGLNGNEIYSEPRGLDAGYHWPQYSVHRGKLQMMLYNAALERLGNDCIHTGVKVTGYENLINGEGIKAQLEDRNGNKSFVTGSLLVAADGLHSAVRQQMHPQQPPIQWGGSIMWRGVTRAKPIRNGASFVGLGTHKQRVVFYPISAADPETGRADINWIAEITVDNSEGWTQGDWNKKVEHTDFVHHFSSWDYGWINVPELLADAKEVFEYPMIDRDPLPTWLDGAAVLLGDAAHVMYPTGSNGASQAIMDSRVLGAAMLKHGVNPSALQAYNEDLCAEISQLVLRNRGSGPFELLKLLDDRCAGVFENIDDVIPRSEREEFMHGYKTAAGFAADKLNASSDTIPLGAKISG
jgi:2-polyprenyl-6-methoxyphenol hydroxylase-like FAD-dependent oxidoreductase